MHGDLCGRESIRGRQHVTRPTGVAETKLDEDPEAEEAAAASADESGLSTPKSALDSTNSLLAVDGMCCNFIKQISCLWVKDLTSDVEI